MAEHLLAVGHVVGQAAPVSTPSTARDPGVMRRAVRDYVLGVHATYLDHVRHLPPGERAALPLVAGRPLTVAVAAARQLHLLAVTGSLPAVVDGPDDEDEHAGVHWVVRFYDPSVLPELGLLADDDPAAVRRVLGVSEPVYHLTVTAGGGLDAHHAQHSGVALANRHTRTGRDLERVRAALPGRSALVDEFGVCVRLELDTAAGALARELSSGRVSSPLGTPAGATLAALVADVRRR